MSAEEKYSEFLEGKKSLAEDVGFDVGGNDLNPMLFDFQKALTEWALKKGRAAVLADCGLGKTVVQLCWADNVVRRTNRPALIVAPLAVSHQTKREGERFGYEINVCREQADVKSGINITNYEMLQRFDRSLFSALVLDESSILKGIYGKFRQFVTDFGSGIPYRLACTATPAPNDTMEIVNHAEFLGVMTAKEVFGLFFTQDFTATSHKWKLKGHATRAFWQWLASWARALRKPSDLGFEDNGFILPDLNIVQHIVETDPTGKGMLFNLEAQNLQEQRASLRASLQERVNLCAKMVNTSAEQWIVWCNLNAEGDAAARAVTDAVQVAGSDTREHKENTITAFQDGEIRVLVSKPSIFGFGLNLQRCHNVVFLGLSHSFEAYYQAVRRCWRFGQEKPVNVHVITADTDGAVVRNIQRKEQEWTSMFDELLMNMDEFQRPLKERAIEIPDEVLSGERWKLFLGDSVDTIDRVETESVGLSVFSPPFPGMYVYTDDPRDMGNVKDINEMIDHFRFLIAEDKLLRVLMPGRSCCIHLTQALAFKHSDGYVGLKDFRGAVIAAMEGAGWVYYGEVCIDKDPQLKALRTKDQGLLFQTLAKDSAKSRPALADYLLQFRKPGDNPEPIRAGKADHLGKSGNGWISNIEWIEWAAPVWYRKTDAYPGGIRESDVLSVQTARGEDDEKHLCPLQLGVVERAVMLWSNPGDIVYSPFAGIGSEGYVALKLGRRFIGGELKRSYFDVATKNLRAAEKLQAQASLFESHSSDREDLEY